MESIGDVRKVAYEFLEARKAFLQENEHLPSIAVILEPTGNVNIIEVDLSEKEVGKGSMQEVRELASNSKAVAILTITASTYRVFPPEKKEDAMTFDDPDLAEAWKPDGMPKKCVSMDIKIEGQPTTNVLIPYWRNKLGKIVFGPAEEGPIDYRAPEPPLPGEDPGPMD
jgi:hypothetical protein